MGGKEGYSANVRKKGKGGRLFHHSREKKGSSCCLHGEKRREALGGRKRENRTYNPYSGGWNIPLFKEEEGKRVSTEKVLKGKKGKKKTGTRGCLWEKGKADAGGGVERKEKGEIFAITICSGGQKEKKV